MASATSRKRSSRRRTRVLERKSERQATRQALAGGNVRQLRTDRWAHRPDPAHLPDEAA